jgi:hypothetical protein
MQEKNNKLHNFTDSVFLIDKIQNKYAHLVFADFQINWSLSAQELHNFIRGNEKVPGAWALINGEVRAFVSYSQVKDICLLVYVFVVNGNV